MLSKKTLFYIAGGFVIGIFYYWFNAYNELSVWGIRIRTLLMTACSIVAFLLCYLDGAKPISTALKISCGVILAVLLRIVWDITLIDPTHHNLAPFEIIISFVLAFITALIGGGIGFLVKPKRQNHPSS